VPPNAWLRGTLAVLAACFALAALTAGILSAFPVGETPVSDPIDFLAFDGAAHAAAHGADPYLAEPLRSYERAELAESHIKMVPNLVVPAPLPPYELALFAPLAFVPFRIASAAWLALALLAVAVTIVLLRRTTGAPLLAIAPALLLADAFSSVSVGQIVPLMLCALCAAGAALAAGRPRTAALAALATACEPHVGLAVCAGLFVWEPRARRTLAVGAAALAVLSLCSGGIARNLEYLTVVLPAQARGEGLEFGGQYSVSALLAAYGVQASLALALGSVAYLAAAGAGVAFGGSLARALRSPAAIVFLPAALAVVGGTYVHIHQIAFALPVVLLAFARAPQLRLATLAALLLLTVPWEIVAEIPGVGPAHHVAHRVDVKAALARVAAPDLPAEVAWSVWVRSGERDSRTRFERLLFKLPTWAGLLLALAALAACARREPFRRPAARVPAFE